MKNLQIQLHACDIHTSQFDLKAFNTNTNGKNDIVPSASHYVK